MIRMNLQLFAHKKGMGSSRNGRDSQAQRLGIKKFGGQRVTAGSIIVRQHGTKVHAGVNVGMGKDYTLFATADGLVQFDRFGKTGKRGLNRAGSGNSVRFGGCSGRRNDVVSNEDLSGPASALLGVGSFVFTTILLKGWG